MGRSLRTDIFRPETCPDGHDGPIHLHRYSSWTPEHQKVQYACLPTGEFGEIALDLPEAAVRTRPAVLRPPPLDLGA